jgi:hypothetical protein
MQKSLVLAVVAVISFGVLFVLSRDADAPDDQHLVATPLPVSTEANGFFMLVDLLEELDWPEDDAWVHAIPRSEIPDSRAILDLMTRNEAVLERLPEVVAAAAFRAPESTQLEPPRFVPRARLVGHVVTLGAALRMHRGEEAAAFDLVFSYLELGHRFHGTGELLYYLVGSSYETLALQQIVLLAADSSGAGLDVLARRVRNSAWERDAMANALRREYVFMTAMLDEPFRQGGVWDAVLAFGGYLYQPNRTRQLFVDSFSDALAALNEDCSTAKREPDSVGMPKWRYLAPNSIGRILHAVGSPNLAGFTWSRCREQMSIGLAELVLALYAHRSSEGELPRSLDELVPEYLEALPVDVDGRGFRYSPAESYLYSVGEDRLDQGGGEPAFRVEWTDPDPGVSLRAH